MNIFAGSKMSHREALAISILVIKLSSRSFPYFCRRLRFEPQ